MIFFFLLSLFSFASLNACEMPSNIQEAVDVRGIELEKQKKLYADLGKDEQTALAATHELVSIVKTCIEHNDPQGITILNTLASHENRKIKAYGNAYLGYAHQTGTMHHIIDCKVAHRLYCASYPALDSNVDGNLKIFITYNSGLLFYEGGKGIEKDYEKADKHFELVIARTQPTDAYHIGSYYSRGLIHYAQENLQEALNFIAVAEQQTTFPEISFRAAVTLGTIYQTPGPLCNVEKALILLQKAVDQTEYADSRAQAAYALALVYSRGVTGLKPKKQLARRYAHIALEDIDDEAKKQELEKLINTKRRKANPRVI